MIRQTKEGYWIVDGDSHIGKWVEESQRLDHDQNTLPILYKYVRPGDVVLDIGANIGDHTIAYSDWVGNKGYVFAFECGDEPFKCLAANMKDRPNVACCNFALWSKNGFLNFNKDSLNVGASFVNEVEKSQFINQVQCRSIDSMDLIQVDFMKIDAEGAETEILLGAYKTIERCRPIICLEVNPSALIRNKSSEEALLSLIEAMGYWWNPIHEDRNQSQYDIICRKKHYPPSW